MYEGKLLFKIIPKKPVKKEKAIMILRVLSGEYLFNNL